MAKTTKVVITAAAAVGVALGAWSMFGASPDDDEAQSAKLLKNHIWVNRMPKGERDMVAYFVALDHPQGQIGAAGRASGWRQLTDLLMWKLEGKKLKLFFGQEEVTWKANAKAWRCKDAPKGFELCLRIWDDSHNVLMYSRDEWELDPEQDHVDLGDEWDWVGHIAQDVVHHDAKTDAELESYEPTADPPSL